jgi:ribosomal protein L35
VSKLKATQRGKSGKHKAQDTRSSIYIRSLRKARVVTPLDLKMIDRIRIGSIDEPDGALAGSSQVKLSDAIFKVSTLALG